MTGDEEPTLEEMLISITALWAIDKIIDIANDLIEREMENDRRRNK